MAYKDPNRCKEYTKAYYQAHKEQEKAKVKAYYQSHKEQIKASQKAYYDSHKEQVKARVKAWKEAHKEESKAWRESNKEQINAYKKEYRKSELNSLGQTKQSIRQKSMRYLSKYCKKIPGYEIHHCCTYTEPYKFIYCSREMHKLIHSYLRQHNIDADSNHYEHIKHLLDDTVVLYGIE